jgi:hypothetical protein
LMRLPNSIATTPPTQRVAGGAAALQCIYILKRVSVT